MIPSTHTIRLEPDGAQAVRMFQFAIATRDAGLSQELTHRAIEYLDQAMELEREQASQHPKSDPDQRRL